MFITSTDLEFFFIYYFAISVILFISKMLINGFVLFQRRVESFGNGSDGIISKQL